MTNSAEDPNDALSQGRAPDKSRADLRARFATPIEADQPVNPDEEARDPFAPPPPAEQGARDAD